MDWLLNFLQRKDPFPNLLQNIQSLLDLNFCISKYRDGAVAYFYVDIFPEIHVYRQAFPSAEGSCPLNMLCDLL